MKILAKISKLVNISLFRDDKCVSYMQAKEMMRGENKIILLDVRSKQEHEECHLEGDICIPLYELGRIEQVVPDKSSIIIAYCQSGARSKKAVNVLGKMGYNNVYQIKGGIDEI